MSSAFEITRPTPIPNKDAVVNCVTAFPAMSPMLFLFAKRRLILALVADAHRKVTFFPMLAKEARYINAPGNLKVVISIIIEAFMRIIHINRHFFTSSSKLLPYLPAKIMAPSWPIPSFRTQV